MLAHALIPVVREGEAETPLLTETQPGVCREFQRRRRTMTTKHRRSHMAWVLPSFLHDTMEDYHLIISPSLSSQTSYIPQLAEGKQKTLHFLWCSSFSSSHKVTILKNHPRKYTPHQKKSVTSLINSRTTYRTRYSFSTQILPVNLHTDSNCFILSQPTAHTLCWTG